jgi:hypothetical protein
MTGRPSIPEALIFNREAAAYWITRLKRVMTAEIALRGVERLIDGPAAAAAQPAAQ